MANPNPTTESPVQLSETADPLITNEYTEFNSVNFPPLDIDFLSNNDLGFMDDLDFSLDDLSYPTDGSDVLSLEFMNQDSGDWLLNDDGGDPSPDSENIEFSVSDLLSSLDSEHSGVRSSTDSENFDYRVSPPVLALDSSDRSSNDGEMFDRKVQESSLRCLNGDSRVLNSLSPDLAPASASASASASISVSSYQDSGGDCCTSVVNGFLNSPSPESNFVSGSTHSPSSSNVQSDDVVVMDVELPPSPSSKEVKVEEEGKVGGSVLKRKKEKEDENNPNNSNSTPRYTKFRKAMTASTPLDKNVAPVEDKKKSRLMRNRESAQLSRQRKKHYVEELEDKVRSMHTMIADLNNRVAYIMAENVSLRQQLSGVNVVPPPGVYPMVPPTMAYPWVPCGSYPMKPHGSQVPLVPIPRLKSRQPISAPKVKKSESKKGESKTKKVSSVTFLGLLFFVFLFWGLVPLVNVRYGGKVEMGSSGFGSTTESFNVHHKGRVLTVNNHLNGSHESVDVGVRSGKSDLRECGTNRINCRKVWVEGAEGKQGSQPLSNSNGLENGGNSSEPLAASLYVPRNDKLVKIDGNLIIHSVLASEKAMTSRASSGLKSDKAPISSTNGAPQTSLAIADNLAASFSVANGGRLAERHPHMYRGPSVQHKALDSGSRDSNKESPRSTAADGSLQKWFREGLAGPILSSGMCTEVFQFDISPSANPGGIIPATSNVNVSAKNASESVHLSKRNRRILKHLPVPLAGSEFNHTEEHAGIPSQNGDFHKNKSVSPMVVSVLVDPREVGDIEVDGGISPKSLSRIFVVVLIDRVKYVTYSCMLPFKGSSSHLTT